MPIDTSMYANQVQPTNPLDRLASVQGISNAMQQNKLLQLAQQTGAVDLQQKQNELTTQNAQIQAARAAIDPATGEIDPAKYQNALTQGGATNAVDQGIKLNQLTAPTPYVATDASGNQQPRMMSAQAMRTQLSPHPQQPQFDDAHAKTDAIGNSIVDLLSLPDDQLTTKAVVSKVGDLCADGHFTPQVGASVCASTPPNDPTQLRPWLANALTKLTQQKQQLNQNAPSTTQLASQAQPSPQDASAGQPANQQPAPAVSQPPSVAAGVPVGYADQQAASRERINQVQNAASSAGQTNAVLENIEDLAKTAPTGTAAGKIYSYLANKGIAAPGVTDKAQQLQEITKYMQQAALAGGMPASDARLTAVEHANTNPDQLPGTIQSLIPFLKATNQGALLKQGYYNKQLGGSLDPDKEVAAKQAWDEHYDPRLIELQSLPAAQQAGYVKDHPEIKALLPKYKWLRDNGVFGLNQ